MACPQNYDNLGPDAAEFIRQAIDQGADAIVGPNWVPDAMDPAFQAVFDADIPLVIYNAGGIEAADRLGAMNYVGAVDYKSGYAGGEYLATAGHTNGAFVNSLPGAANIEAFCNGFNDGIAAGGGTGSVLQLPATAFGDATAVAQAGACSPAAEPGYHCHVCHRRPRHQRDHQRHSTGWQNRFSSCLWYELQRLAILANIQGGTQACAIDQQGYQQGFFAVSILNNHVMYGTTIPTREILTGPGVIDSSNVDLVIAGVKAGAR